MTNIERKEKIIESGVENWKKERFEFFKTYINVVSDEQFFN